MKIRLEDTPEHVEAFAAVLRATFEVRNETSNYRNRPPSPIVRRYLTAKMRPDTGSSSSKTAEQQDGAR